MSPDLRLIGAFKVHRPNILLITSDQQHWNTIGKFNPEIQTPALDRLANEGTTFRRAYCPNPTCTPTRASIITGKYPSQHGAWTLGTKLSEDQPTLGQYLQRAGYRTGLIGKAHFQPLRSTPEYESIESYPILHDLEFWKRFHGPYYGFEHVELARNHTSEAHVGQHYALWLQERCGDDWRRYFSAPTGTLAPDAAHSWAIPEGLHYNTWIAERTTALIERHHDNDERFFLWASFLDPHPPYLVPGPWDRMYDPERLTVPEVAAGEHDRNPPQFALTQQAEPDFSHWNETGHAVHGHVSHIRSLEERHRIVATYYGMMSFLDKYVGVILDKLDALGIANDTIVIFTTDHGHFFGQHGLQAKGPFHYEDLLRVPLIVRYPGLVPAGALNSKLQSLTDLAPTLLHLARLDVPPDMTGRNQWPVWSGDSDGIRGHVICEFHHEPTTVHLRTYIEDRYKLTVYLREESGELYDLHDDAAELHNRWDDPAYAALKSALLLRFMWAELERSPMPMPRIAVA
ncbi:sulfatase family protein [Kribbella sp. CA-294648]|uniref:sulfatase family protein n=1 Tax=Kribbella sp. CA-294648 TaxID=3239948 RepID=UPI003D9013EC